MRPSQAQVFRRRRFLVFGGLGILLAGFGYLPMTLLAPLQATAPEVLSYETPTLEPLALDWPSNAATAIGAVGFPGILAATGTTDQRSIASITKVITALVVLDKHPLAAGEDGPAITFNKTDVSYYSQYLSVGGTVEPVRAGLVLTERQVLQAVLIASANNYAKSLARWAFGSEQEFLNATGAWLDAHGLVSTAIYEPTGMNPENVSTTADLLEIAKMAVANPVVAEIVSTTQLSLPYIGELENSNKLLGALGIDGIKTGTLDAAGACLLFSADFQVGGQSVTVVGVALGGADHKTQFPQVKELMATVAAGFHEVEVASEGTVVAKYHTMWDARAEAIVSKTYRQLVWGVPNISVTVDAIPVSVAEDGAPAGSLRFSVNGKQTIVPLKLEGNLEDPGPLWRLGNPFSLIGN